jgi:hypothetical protein
MSQHDFDVANGTGSAVRGDINAAIQALASQNSGATEPATRYPYMVWADTTAGKIKIRNAANSAWIDYCPIAGPTATGYATLAAASASAGRDAIDAASRQFWKDAVLCATTANITLSGAQTLDGISAIAGDRVLVKNQTTGSQNGIYVVASGSWTRATDMDVWTEVPSAVVTVQQGTVNADRVYLCTSNTGGTIDSTAMTWAQVGAGGLTIVRTLFTGSGTWTKPAGLLAAEIEVLAGGGGGGWNDGSGGSSQCGAGGGYAKRLVDAASLGATETVTVGAGGTGGVAGPGTGGTGGTTSFGSLASATGGTGGGPNGTSTFAAGGVGSSGDINLAGGVATLGTSVFAPQNMSTTGTAGTANRGQGGGGRAAAGNGGAGGSGLVIVTEYRSA